MGSIPITPTKIKKDKEMIILNIIKQGFKDVWFYIKRLEMYLIVYLDIYTDFPWAETYCIYVWTVLGLLAASIMLFNCPPKPIGPSKDWMKYWKNR